MTGDSLPDRDDYGTGVELLCRGRVEEAVVHLEAVPEGSRSPHHHLALVKAYLELGRGLPARQCLEALGEEEGEPGSARAYRELLAAAALARCGDTDEAFRRLELVSAADLRFERAAHALRKRLASGSPPLVYL